MTPRQSGSVRSYDARVTTAPPSAWTVEAAASATDRA